MNEQENMRECPECGRRPGVLPGTLYCRFCGGQIVTTDEAAALWQTLDPGVPQDALD